MILISPPEAEKEALVEGFSKVLRDVIRIGLNQCWATPGGLPRPLMLPRSRKVQYTRIGNDDRRGRAARQSGSAIRC